MVDARGHGLSARIEGASSQVLLNYNVAGVVRALGLGPFRALGFSQGAATGVHVAAALPDLVHSLVAAGWGAPEREERKPPADFRRSAGYQAWFHGHLIHREQSGFFIELVRDFLGPSGTEKSHFGPCQIPGNGGSDP